MGVQRLMKIAAVVVLLLTAFIIIYTISNDYRTAHNDMNISLPDNNSVYDAASDRSLSDEPDIYSQLKELSVETKNIQSVISTLNRAYDYSITAKVKRYYNGNEKSTDIYHLVAGEYSKTEINDGNKTEHILCRDGYVYRWMNNESTYYKTNAGSYSHDDAAEFPTYENVLNLDEKYITDAGYTEIDGQMYVFVEYFMEDLEYIEQYYISIDNGLLMKARTYDDGELIYSMDVLNVDFEQPTDTAMTLPSEE